MTAMSDEVKNILANLPVASKIATHIDRNEVIYTWQFDALYKLEYGWVAVYHTTGYRDTYAHVTPWTTQVHRVSVFDDELHQVGGMIVKQVTVPN